MALKVHTEIRDNYSFYDSLLKNRKSIFTQVISISEIKISNRNFLTNNTDVKHEVLSDEIVLTAEVKIDNHKYFQFKLKCTALSEVPFFRFDSDGGAHRNYDETLPFNQQQITTPHFHIFNEKGVSIAYKTTQLENENEKKALEDISLCISHFCHESNIRLSNDDFPTITIVTGKLPFNTEITDPNKGIQFK